MRFAKNTQHDTSKVLRLPRKMAMDTSKVLRLPRKLQHIFWKRRKSIAPATQNDFRHVPEHVWMSRSATPATRNEATTRLKPPKITTSAELPIGTAIRSSRGRLRTVANGCGRLRSRTQRRANTPSTPRPPEWNGNPCYAFGKKAPPHHLPRQCPWSDNPAPVENVWWWCHDLLAWNPRSPTSYLGATQNHQSFMHFSWRKMGRNLKCGVKWWISSHPCRKQLVDMLPQNGSHRRFSTTQTRHTQCHWNSTVWNMHSLNLILRANSKRPFWASSSCLNIPEARAIARSAKTYHARKITKPELRRAKLQPACGRI